MIKKKKKIVKGKNDDRRGLTTKERHKQREKRGGMMGRISVGGREEGRDTALVQSAQ